MRIAALDIGGTSIKSGLWEDGSLSGWRETDTLAKEGGARLMERAVSILREYGPVDAVGVSTAGQVDEKGSIFYANDNIPGYTGMPVREIIENSLGVFAAVENDVNAAAVGEGWLGAARGIKDFLCLTYGTGVGGAIVMGGEIYRGSSFSAGSFGGIVVHPEDIRPGEEFSGCYEKYASATGLVARARELDAGFTDGRAVFSAFARPQVRAVIDGWIDEVVCGLVTLVHVFNPSCMVLGGVVMAQPYVIGQIRERLAARISPGFPVPTLCQAALGNQAGVLGAVRLALKAAG